MGTTTTPEVMDAQEYMEKLKQGRKTRKSQVQSKENKVDQKKQGKALQKEQMIEDDNEEREDGEEEDADAMSEDEVDSSNSGTSNGQSTAQPKRSATPARADDLEYDLGLLAAFDFTTTNSTAGANQEAEDESIDNDSVEENGSSNKKSRFLDDKFNIQLKSRARILTQFLVNRLFSLPSENGGVDIGRLIVLPSPRIPLPRSLPLPKAKPMTKWETFAQTKGIQKQKRGRMVWDEEGNQWAPRYGYKRANNESDQVIIEHKEGRGDEVQNGKVKSRRSGKASSSSKNGQVLDPWSAAEHERKERVNKNTKQRVKNAHLASGERRIAGQLDLTSVSQKAQDKSQIRGRGKRAREFASTVGSSKIGHVSLSYDVASSSTASAGKFDKEVKARSLSNKSAQKKRKTK